MKENQTKAKLIRNEPCYGIMVRETRSPQIMQLLAAAGWDFVVVDAEHGPIGIETLADFAAVMRHEPTTLLVRVSEKLYHLMARPLDLGFEGLVCPRVDSRGEAQTIVRAAKYAPEGDRGVSISGTGTCYRPVSTADYVRHANANTLLAIQIESVSGLERIDEIVSVPGVDAVFIGPEDLSQTMGIPGQVDHARMIEAYQHVVDRCRAHGVASGMHFRDIDMMREWVGRGMRFAAYKTDFRLLLDASRAALAQAKG